MKFASQKFKGKQKKREHAFTIEDHTITIMQLDRKQLRKTLQYKSEQ